MLNKYKKGFTLIELIIVIVILFILCAMAGPSGSPARRRKYAEEKDCFSNQRVLEGAIEMYNMDNSEMITIALPGADYEYIERLLIKDNQLYEPLIPPSDSCSYGYIENEKDVGVFCKKHGRYTAKNSSRSFAEDDPKLPEYDRSKEKSLSSDYYTVRNNLKTSKQIRAIREGIINIIISKPFLIFIGITIFILAVLPYKKKNKSNVKINR